MAGFYVLYVLMFGSKVARDEICAISTESAQSYKCTFLEFTVDCKRSSRRVISKNLEHYFYVYEEHIFVST
jgi:hypothetical protein